MISQFQETQSPLAHLRARANAARTPEDWRGIFAVALAVLDRQRDAIEELEVAIHNADMHRCGSCTALVPVSQEWCELCLRPETWVWGATRHEIDARENPRMVERGMR
jgi:hypothetical protein